MVEHRRDLRRRHGEGSKIGGGLRERGAVVGSIAFVMREGFVLLVLSFLEREMRERARGGEGWGRESEKRGGEGWGRSDAAGDFYLFDE